MTCPNLVAEIVLEGDASTGVPLAKRWDSVAYWMPRYWSTLAWRGALVPWICPREGCAMDGEADMFLGLFKVESVL